LRNLLGKRPSSDKKLVNTIKNIFGFYPKNIALYKLALMHRSVSQSFADGKKINNERLEFLGDAVLSSIVAEYLFKKFPVKEEGFLTEIRSRIVSRSNLNNLSYKLGLNHLIKTHFNTNKTATSISGDAFEAFVGAIYLDKGYEFTRKIIVNKIITLHIDIEELISTELNFKSKLIEWGQKNKKEINFKLIEEKEANNKLKIYIVEAEIDKKVFGTGKDYSIKKAEQIAAKIAWDKLVNDD